MANQVLCFIRTSPFRDDSQYSRSLCELALEDDDVQSTRGLMTALDELNQRYGRGTVQMASASLAGERRVWSMKQERRTSGYTTCWADMLVVRA